MRRRNVLCEYPLRGLVSPSARRSEMKHGLAFKGALSKAGRVCITGIQVELVSRIEKT